MFTVVGQSLCLAVDVESIERGGCYVIHRHVPRLLLATDPVHHGLRNKQERKSRDHQTDFGGEGKARFRRSFEASIRVARNGTGKARLETTKRNRQLFSGLGLIARRIWMKTMFNTRASNGEKIPRSSTRYRDSLDTKHFFQCD